MSDVLNLDSRIKSPGAVQGWILVATMWLAAGATALVAPVLPRMAAHFAAVPHAVMLVQFSVTLPALFIALLAWVFGQLADRIGRRRVLLGGLLLYVLCGTAPMVLNSLPLILVSRAGVGIAEAAAMVTGLALIGDYFDGARRENWFAMRAGSTTVAAPIFFGISGYLGQTSWRTPFSVYGLAAILAVLAAAYIWEPAQPVSRNSRHKAAAQRLQGRFVLICAFSVFAAVAFYILILQLPFVLSERGYGAPRLVALPTALAASTAPLGAIIFRLMIKKAQTTKLALSFFFTGFGLAIIALVPNYLASLAGAAIDGLGSGLVLPTLMAWALQECEPSQRGRAAGLWNAAWYLGVFISPLVFLAIFKSIGSRPVALLVCASVLGLAAAITFGRR